MSRLRGENEPSRWTSMKRGAPRVRAQDVHRRVEALDVADLQHRARARRPAAMRSSASASVAAIGFSTSTSLPASRSDAGHAVVVDGGHGDGDRVRLGQQRRRRCANDRGSRAAPRPRAARAASTS